MAKAKKQESATAHDKAAKAKAATPAAAKKAPTKKETAAESKSAAAAAKKPAASRKPAASAGGKPLMPLIDTGLAAQTAAAMVARRVAGGTAPTGGPSEPSQESSTFKNLKESLSKPTAGGLGGILGTGSGQKKFSQQFGGGGAKQGGPGGGGGRNQTFGADVNRAGVPRRTGGG
jgi:hypothetical protein